MACNARVCTPKAQLGLPELQLGVIPGFGGTQRLPRPVGLPKALEMIMKSKSVKAEEALKLGLVDQVVRAVAARRGDGSRGGHRRQARAARHGVLPLGQDARRRGAQGDFGGRSARREARQGRDAAPLALFGRHRGGPRERRGGRAEGGTRLVRQSRLERGVQGPGALLLRVAADGGVPGVTDVGLAPCRWKTVGVVGGGLMGSGIATACVMNGVSVVLKEINQKFLDAGMGRVRANLQSAAKKGRLDAGARRRDVCAVPPGADVRRLRQGGHGHRGGHRERRVEAEDLRGPRGGVPPGRHPQHEHVHHRHHQVRGEDARAGAYRGRALLLARACHAVVRDHSHGSHAAAGAVRHSRSVEADQEDAGGGGQLHRVRGEPRVFPVHHVGVPASGPGVRPVRYRRRRQDVRHAHGPVPPERPRGHGHRRARRQELRGGLPRPRLRVPDHPEPDGGEPLRREERRRLLRV